MPDPGPFTIRVLAEADLPAMRELLSVFSEAFGMPEMYMESQPDDGYLTTLLGRDDFIAVVGEVDGKVVGGLTAYELRKPEQARSEMYIYDLAVAEEHRRKGIATGLIRQVQMEGEKRGAWVVIIEADYGDDPAIALYTKLGVREEVLHFDLPVPAPSEGDAR